MSNKKRLIIWIVCIAVSVCVTVMIVFMFKLQRTDLEGAESFGKAEKGNIITFGSYEQDNDTANGKEPLRWMVIEQIDDRLLLLSEYCIDCEVYNGVAFESVTWESSEIRKWLNEDFYSEAFSEEDKQYIAVTENVNPDQSSVGTNGGNDTEDKVFLLCEKEVGIYMGDDMNRTYYGCASATEYAVFKGAHTDENGMAEWWLRTPGVFEHAAQFVDSEGMVYVAGASADIAYGVRPAIWVTANGNETE